MIKCPIFRDSQRRPVHAAVALMLILVAVLLIAGCMGGDAYRDQDLVVIKLNQNGSTVWMKTIDSGKSDWSDNVIQTSDEGYTIAGGYSTPLCNSFGPATPTVIRLSKNGDVLWRKDYVLSSPDAVTRSPDQLSGIVQSPENGYYLISQYGMIIKLDAQGNPVWKKNLSSADSDNFNIYYPPLQNEDGSILIGGSVWQCSQRSDASRCGTGACDYRPFIAKLDRDGNQLWFTKISDVNFWNVISLIKLPGNRGYIGLGQNKTGTRPLFKLDENDHYINSSPVSSIADTYQIHSVSDGFSAILLNHSMNNTFEESTYTIDGAKIRTIALWNITQREAPADRDSTIFTSKENYFTIYLGEFGTLYAQEVNHNDEKIWNHQITSFTKRNYLIHIQNVIETTDNGYLIILGIQKERSC